jgi:hypothetical protein
MTADDDCGPTLGQRLDQRASLLGRDGPGSEEGNPGATRGELRQRGPFRRDVRQSSAVTGKVAAQIDHESTPGHLGQAQSGKK